MIKAFIFCLGIALLLTGRRLFWLFLGVSGFLAGLEFSRFYFVSLPWATALMVALICGALGIVMAVAFQKIAIGAAGFISGALFTYSIPEIFGYVPLMIYQLVVLLGAILGAVLALMFFDWSLVVFSSLIGAALAVYAAGGNIVVQGMVFAVLLAVGIAFQAAALTRSPGKAEER